jgi:plasmid stability protein
MTDILIRDVPEDVIHALEAQAARLGLSRTEFLRRCLAHEAVPVTPVSVESFAQFAQTCADLRDPEVMRGAWA